MYRNIKKIMFFTLALLVILQLPTFNREVKAKNNELQLSELTIIENQQNNSHYKFTLGWKILGRVEEGDYFYLDIKGQESDKIPEEFLSQDGVRGVHMGNGRYKFTMPASYDKKKNVEGGFGAEFNLSRGGSVLQISSSGLSQYLSLDHVKTGGSYTDDEVYSKGLMKNIYLKDGAYYIDWYVRLGSRGKNVYRFAMTDSLGEGHSLVKESVKVSFGGEMAYPISQSNKTGVSLDNLGLSDKTISFVLANNNTYKGQERVTIFYTSKIDDINREVYLNNLYLSKDGKTIANVTKEATWSSYAWSKAELDENFSKLVIKKMDKMNERPLEGAIFNIFDGEGRLIKSNLQTDSRGEISHYLIEGDYRLIEISAPEGYEIDQPAIEFSISADDIGKDKIIKVYNSKEKSLDDIKTEEEIKETIVEDHEDWTNSEKDYDKALEDYYANEAKKEDQEKPVEDKKDDQEQEEPITKEDKDQPGLEKDQEKPVEDKKDDDPGEDSGISIAPVQPETPELIEPLEPETPCLDEEKEKEEDDDSGVLGFIKIPEEKEDEDSAVLGIKNESHKTRPENDKDQDKKMSPAPQTGDGGVEIYSLLALLSILMVVSIRQKKIKE